MTLNEKFLHQLKQTSADARQSNYLLAVSGGVDSVVLCDLFSKSGLNFTIAHCNFQLRGEESERDEKHVRSLAEKYSKTILVKRFDTSAYASEHKLSIQVAARDLRYDWFRSLISEETGKPFDYIVTAHHADDNIETVVMNFFRGTGLRGLVGMDVHFQKIFRPLLQFRKQEIIEYASENNLAYVEDSSNISSNYTRNYFRNELLPSIAKVFPGVEENILKNIERLAEVEQIYGQAIKRHLAKLVEVKDNEEHLPILKLKKLQSFKTILWEIIKEKGFTAAQLPGIVKLLDADNGSFIESDLFRIIKNRKWLIIAPKQSELAKNILIKETDKQIAFDNGTIEFQRSTNLTPSTSSTIACVDAGKITFPLLLRQWKQGDYFYPLGMQKKKKLSRFLIDQKLSRTDKENVWVLEMNKKIVWVIGYRLDDRFKIEASTKKVLEIKLQPSIT